MPCAGSHSHCVLLVAIAIAVIFTILTSTCRVSAFPVSEKLGDFIKTDIMCAENVPDVVMNTCLTGGSGKAAKCINGYCYLADTGRQSWFPKLNEIMHLWQ